MDPKTMDPIAKIIHRRMLERQRAKEKRQQKTLPPLSSPEPLVAGEEENSLAVTPVVEDPVPCAFLDLPFDVRRVILRYLLGMDQVRTVTRKFEKNFYTRPKHDVSYSMNTAVLRTCKQLLTEGSIVLRENSFVAVPNFRPRTGRIPTWKLPQPARSRSSLSTTFSSEIKPILTVKSTDPHEKKGYNSFISILDFRLYCESWMFTAEEYHSYQWRSNPTTQGQFSFELEFVPGLAQKLWGFPNEKVFLDYISTSIRESIGPLVKTVRLGDFELSCISPSKTSPDNDGDRDDGEKHTSHPPSPPQKLTNLEQKIWDMFKPGRDPGERARRFQTADQRIQAAFNKAERMFEDLSLEEELRETTVQVRDEFKKVKEMILAAAGPVQSARLNWCLFRLATMKTAIEINGGHALVAERDLKDLQEAQRLNDLANRIIAGDEYRLRLGLRKAELSLLLSPAVTSTTTTTTTTTMTRLMPSTSTSATTTSTIRSENELIKLLCNLAWEFAPYGTEYRFQEAKLDWVHRSVHGDDDSKNWERWTRGTLLEWQDYRIKDAVGETLEPKIDRVRSLIVARYGQEARWKHFDNICYQGSAELQAVN